MKEITIEMRIGIATTIEVNTKAISTVRLRASSALAVRTISPITAHRTLQFSENQPSQFFIAVEGVEPVVFNSNNPPAIVTTQGAMEIWTIQNLAQESHDFHLHQIHYKVLAQENFEINGAHPAPGIEGQFMDTIDIPPWDNVNHPNGPVPQVKLLMDFRGMDVGSFVYHCHILSHEDLGMMAIIQVNPKK